MTQDQLKRFKDLAEKYSLTKDDFWKSPQGFVIISRRGIEKIQSAMGANVTYEVVSELSDVSENKYVIKAIGEVMMSPEVYNRLTHDEATGRAVNRLGMVPRSRRVETFGESSPKNTRGGAQGYPVAMAEKRALSRCILKLSDFYQFEVFGEDEISDEK